MTAGGPMPGQKTFLCLVNLPVRPVLRVDREKYYRR